MKTCHKCGNIIGGGAEFCPHCGYKPGTSRYLGIVLAGLIAVVLICGLYFARHGFG